MIVLFYTKLNKIWNRELSKLIDQFPEVEFINDSDPDAATLESIDIIIGGVVSEKTIQIAKNLKLIIVPFAGVDHLPFQLLRTRGIQAANSHGNANSVAERSLAMILAFYGKIVDYHNDLKSGHWHGFWVKKGLDDTWESIRGKTCSIIGAGSIGKSLARILKPFDIRITAYKRKLSAALPENFDEIVYDIDEAIARSEIIVLTLPSTAETKGIINSERLKKMSGKVIINVGRGDLLDEKALYHALDSGILKGAAIDCWFQYPQNGETFGYPSDLPIHNLPNVILSPHVAGFTSAASEDNILQAINNLQAFLLHQKMISPVDLLSGY